MVTAGVVVEVVVVATVVPVAVVVLAATEVLVMGTHVDTPLLPSWQISSSWHCRWKLLS